MTDIRERVARAIMKSDIERQGGICGVDISDMTSEYGDTLFAQADAALLACRYHEMREALKALVNAEALSKVEDVVAGWNGPPEKPHAPHPSQMGARIETTCGRMYKLDAAIKAARAALEDKP